MTIQEYDALVEGDLVQHRYNQTIKVVVEKNAAEPITQVSKHKIKEHFLDWKIHTKCLPKLNQK